MKNFGTDLPLKILSVAIAIVLWFYVLQVQSPDIERTIKNVPVVFTQKASLEAKGLMLINDKNQTVDVKIKGRRRYVMGVSHDNINIMADVGNIENTGTHPVYTSIALPYGSLEVVSKNPTVLSVDVDYLERVEKTVEVSASGSVKSGYFLGTSLVSSEAVNIKGPKSIVDGIVRVAAEIDVSGRDITSTDTVELKLYDSNDKEIKSAYITLSEKNVDVTTEILRTKTINIMPVYENEAVTEKFTPDASNRRTVVIAGPEAVIAGINEVKTKPIHINDGFAENTVNVELELPQGVRLVDTKSISYKYSIIPHQE